MAKCPSARHQQREECLYSLKKNRSINETLQAKKGTTQIYQGQGLSGGGPARYT